MSTYKKKLYLFTVPWNFDLQSQLSETIQIIRRDLMEQSSIIKA